MTTKHRVTILLNNKVDKDDFQDLYLARTRWTIPGGSYQRQDRFTIPHDSLVSLLGSDVDSDLIDQFAIQFSVPNNTDVAQQVEKLNPDLTNLNTALTTKYIEPGYSVFVKPRANVSSDSALSKAFSGLTSILDYSPSPANFVKNPVSLSYVNADPKAAERAPQKLAEFAVKAACSAENPEDVEQCKVDYTELLKRASSISVEYNNPNSPNSIDRNKKDLKNTFVTVFWNTGSLKDMNTTTLRKPVGDKLVRELGMFEIDHRASLVSELNLFGMSAKLPVDLPPKTDEDGKPLFDDEDKDTLVGAKTMFFVLPRHVALSKGAEIKYNSSFSEPVGLHPEHVVSIETSGLLKRNTTSGLLSLEPPMNQQIFDCELFSYYRLPNALFIDLNEYNDKHEHVELVGVWGATDLEAPSYRTDKWGSSALFKLKVEARDPNVFDLNKELQKSNSSYEDLYKVKFHSRYQLAAGSNKYDVFHAPKPDVFWACELSKLKLEKAKESNLLTTSTADEYERQFSDDLIYKNPLDTKVQMNMEGLFTNNAMFYHLKPSVENISNVYEYLDAFAIPKGSEPDFLYIQVFTILVVVGSVLYFIKKVYSGFQSKLIYAEVKDVKEDEATAKEVKKEEEAEMEKEEEVSKD